jgi:hypothetical protein
LTDVQALTPPVEGGDTAFWARRAALVARIDTEMARTDWLSLPRMLRWRFLLGKANAELLAREFMRMLCLIQLSPRAIIVPGLLMNMVGWFERNPSYKVHVTDFTGPLPELRPVRVAEGDIPWCHTLNLYEEVFGTPPPPAIWTPGSPVLHPWRTGWIVGAILKALHLITFGLILCFFLVPMVLTVVVDSRLTIALADLFSFETSERLTEARQAFFFISSCLLWMAAFVKLESLYSRNLSSLPVGHPFHHAFRH